jgi:hypothetical protein
MIGIIPAGSEARNISANAEDLDVATIFSAGNLIPKLYIAVVATGVVIGDLEAGYSLSTANLHTGSGFVLVNNGHLLGGAGAGAQGGNIRSQIGDDCGSGQNCGGISLGPFVGGWVGGDGLRLSNQLSSVTIDNTNGNIWGGGGGGGGGGPLGFISDALMGGGGGAGAGYPNPSGGGSAGIFIAGSGGICEYAYDQYNGVDGGNTSGSTPATYARGLGGVGGGPMSVFTAGGGGNGGDWATSGTNAVPQSHGCEQPAVQGYRVGTNGGPAGKAVVPNGAPTITWLGGSSFPNIKGAIT